MDLGDRLAFHIRWTIPAENFCVEGSDSLSKNMKKKYKSVLYVFLQQLSIVGTFFLLKISTMSTIL